MSRKENESYAYLMHSASASDQTGLIPSAITSEAEEESYQNLYPYPPPTVRADPKQQAKNSAGTENGQRASAKRSVNGHLSEQEVRNLHKPADRYRNAR